ncbi:MAG: hypothetical protein CSA96_08985 [Bacteroidetes bacterium]|nr:MAG: hypothetical protein CSA96_08985 [Bacteroidota bacterium]
MKTLLAGLLILTGTAALPLSAQKDQEAIAGKGLESFENKDYRSALEAYTRLLEANPGNALYKYYKGVCLVELHEELDEAVELLYGASKSAVPGDALYYLALAYHHSYNFSEALRYYGRFERSVGKRTAQGMGVRRQMASCRAAKELTAMYNPYEVMNVSFINLYDSLQFTQVKMKGGQMQRKPPAYFKGKEDRGALTSIMFMPEQLQRGSYVYYAGYGRSKKEGSQLFRVRKGAGQNWAEPEAVAALNSEGDELLPYFDPIENDLYYASNGRQGIGGFDLYKSHYDAERDEWSEPINLGFPVNSAMDDYLLLPGNDLGMVMFFSDRQSSDSSLAVYRVHLVEPRRPVSSDVAMMQRISTMDNAAEEAMKASEKLASGDQVPLDPVVTKESLQNGSMKDGPESKTETAYTKVKLVNESDAYPADLGQALRHQARSDSLKDLVAGARLKVQAAEEANDRWVWQKQIMLWEKEAAVEQEQADALYAGLDLGNDMPGKAEPQPEAGLADTPAGDLPETITLDRVVGDTKVYRYTGSSPSDENKPVRLPAVEPVVGPAAVDQSARQPEPWPHQPAAGTASLQKGSPETAPVMNRMEILPTTPYTVDKPIPMDISLPLGVFYRIQLGAVSTPAEPGTFGGISPVTGEFLPDRGLYKYYAGKFSHYDAASAALSRIRSRGYEDAFIVSWYQGKPISVQRAKQLE